MIVAIICMTVFLLFDDPNDRITKEERLYNLSFYCDDYKNYKVDVAGEISAALEHKKWWHRLFISDNFKNKYKNPKRIISNVNQYESFYGEECYDYENKNVIIIYGDKKDPLIEKRDYEPIMTEFYFEYFMDDNNEIDDIKLLKKIDMNATTLKPIEQKQ